MQQQGVLSGYKIIDLTSVVLGPFCTQMMGDLGAEVIKVETLAGDTMRHAGPHVTPGMGPIYLTINRNKRSLTLDLRKDEAKEVLRKLIKEADGFIHNIRAGGMRRLGFDYESVKAINPKILYLHAVGYGSEGPYAERQAYDDLVQCASGMASMLPLQDGSEAPRYFPGLVADKTTGLYAAYAMMAGFLHRERTGRGQFIEVPMLECMVNFTMAENLYGRTFVPPKGGTTYTRSINPQRKPYKTKDGYLGIMPYTDANWADFFTLGGMPDLMKDPKFNTYANRTENITELYNTIEEIALQKTSQEWMSVLGKANVPCMKVQSLDEVLEDPQLVETGFFEQREHPTEGTYVAVNNPVAFSDSPTHIYRDPPVIGQDNLEILAELGYSEKDIESIQNAGALGKE